MKTILSAVLFVSFLFSGPAAVLAGDAEAPPKKDAKKEEKKAPDKGATKKGDAPSDGYRSRGK